MSSVLSMLRKAAGTDDLGSVTVVSIVLFLSYHGDFRLPWMLYGFPGVGVKYSPVYFASVQPQVLFTKGASGSSLKLATIHRLHWLHCLPLLVRDE